MSATSSRLRRTFLPAAVALLILAGSAVPLPAYIERPGSAAGIPACVTIAARPGAAVDGDYLFTTIAQRDATVFGLLLAGMLDKQRVVSRGDLLGGVRRDRYLEQQRQVFLDSTQRAIVVALRAAGLPVDTLGSGVDVVQVLPGTPADGVLHQGDVITAVNGDTVSTDTELIAAIGDEPLRLRLRRDGEPVIAEVTPSVHEVDGERRPVIGVRVTTHAPRVRLPFDVDVSSGDVGGPSAGLMLGLAIFDLVDEVDLARGRRIAGTGTLALDGTVGTIDGIELKVPAAVREGADVFVAPAAQAGIARSAVPAGSGLTVIGVDTFDAARAALGREGGSASGTAPDQPCRFGSDA